jgi:hypothetical protein
MLIMFYGWYIVAACVLISMYLSGTITMGFTTIFDPIAHETGWSYTQISFAASLRGFGIGLLVFTKPSRFAGRYSSAML